MRKLVASLSLAFLVIGVAATTTGAARVAVQGRHSGCPKRYTVAMATRAARKAYRGTRTPARRDLRHLGKYLKCQRNPLARWYVRWYYSDQRSKNAQRKYAADPSRWPTATASWYDDSGATASGWHSYYGVATCGDQTGVCYPMGTRIQFSYGGHRVTAVVDDAGPYANGASFDLNQNTAAALHFDGVATVYYRVV